MPSEQADQMMSDDSEVSSLIPRMVDGVKRADDRLVGFVKERPLVALGAALALGYVVGRVLTSRG